MLLIFIGVWGAAVSRFGGIRAVIPGHVFRSPQLDSGTLRKAIGDYGLRSVLNLRGRGHGRNWFADERRACEKAGVEHVTVTFNIDEWPPRPVTLKFLETIDSLPQPFLMHCNRGVDRTGWAGAVVVLADGGSLEDAGRQLAPGSGHFCIRSWCPQHLFFAAYRRWLEEHEQHQSAAVFRRWITETYCPDPWNAELKTPAGNPPKESVGGEELALSFEVFNRSREIWHLESSNTRVGIRSIGPLDSMPRHPIEMFLDRQTPVDDMGRSEGSTGDLDPGQAAIFEAKVRMPSEPGLYLMQADLVMEHVHWFSEMGWPGLIWPVEIVEPHRTTKRQKKKQP